MKCSLLNRFLDFEFHDAQFNLKDCENDNLCVAVKHLNIHKNAKENPYEYDMEIAAAEIYFQNLRVSSFEPMRAYKSDNNGNLYTDEPQIIYKGSKAEEEFIAQLKRGIVVYSIDICKDERGAFWSIEANGKNCFTVSVSFDDAVVMWEEYCQKAWYELHRQYDYDITLDTPTGDQKTAVHIVCDEESSADDLPSVSVSIKYEKEEIWGYGKDYLWTDAFADLQKKLLADVKIKGCLVCKHGNMCPVGNFPNEIFCTKDVSITQKSDLFFYTEDDVERAERLRRYTDICEFFDYQSPDFFTYNDWLYHLNK